jgi:hypothetical protein
MLQFDSGARHSSEVIRHGAFKPRSRWSSGFRFCGAVVIVVVTMLAVASSTARAQGPSPTSWITGTATLGAWSNAANWDIGVPTSGQNAIITNSGATISLGSGAVASTLFVQGPVGGESSLSNGDLTLSDQLWIDVAAPGTILRL